MSKGKETHTGKVVDDTLDIVNDFICQTPFWGYQVSAYRDNETFSDLTPILDSYLERLFAGGSIDDGNGDVLDCLIADYARENMKYLSRQRVEHENMMKKFDMQRQGSQKSFEEHLVSIDKQLKEKTEEFTDIKKRYQQDKFKGGHRHE